MQENSPKNIITGKTVPYVILLPIEKLPSTSAKRYQVVSWGIPFNLEQETTMCMKETGKQEKKKTNMYGDP